MEAGEKVSDKDKRIREMAAIVSDPLPYGTKNNRPSIEASSSTSTSKAC